MFLRPKHDRTSARCRVQGHEQCRVQFGIALVGLLLTACQPTPRHLSGCRDGVLFDGDCPYSGQRIEMVVVPNGDAPRVLLICRCLPDVPPAWEVM